MNKVYYYGVGERIWHWLQALGIAILLYTGFAIHFMTAEGTSFLDLYNWHAIVGFILILNTFIGNVYFMSNHKVSQFFPMVNAKFIDEFISQAKYYMMGRFKGEHSSFDKSPENKLNPLQKTSYFGMLFVVLPFQMVTGVFMFFSKGWAEGIIADCGGFATLATAHVVGSFLFSAFLIIHIYLSVTTKNSFRGIITGYEIEEEES